MGKSRQQGMVGLCRAKSGLSGCYSHGYQLGGGGCLFICLLCLVLFHTAETSIDFSKKPRMISNFRSFLCHLPSARDLTVLGFDIFIFS